MAVTVNETFGPTTHHSLLGAQVPGGLVLDFLDSSWLPDVLSEGSQNTTRTSGKFLVHDTIINRGMGSYEYVRRSFMEPKRTLLCSVCCLSTYLPGTGGVRLRACSQVQRWYIRTTARVHTNPTAKRTRTTTV